MGGGDNGLGFDAAGDDDGKRGISDFLTLWPKFSVS